MTRCETTFNFSSYVVMLSMKSCAEAYGRKHGEIKNLEPFDLPQLSSDCNSEQNCFLAK